MPGGVFPLVGISSFLQLLENAALLIAMVYVFDFAIGSYKNFLTTRFRIMSGIALGIICTILMLNPFEVMPGLIVDTRSILLGLTGLFFGYLTSSITMVIAILVRLEIGGVGMVTGVLVIMSSTILGMLLRKYKSKSLMAFTWYQFYAYGLVVNGVFLLLMLYTIPGPAALESLFAVAIPVMLIYPAVMTLLAVLLVNRLSKAQRNSEIRKHMAFLEMAMSAGRQGFFEIDLQTGEVLMDLGLPKLPGEETAARKFSVYEWLESVSPDDRARMQKLHEDLVGGTISEFREEYRQRTPEGNDIWIMAAGKVSEWDRDGIPARILGTNIDITERKESENRLLVFNTLLDQTLDAIEVLDPVTGKFLDCNAAAYKSLGYTREEYLELSVFDIDQDVEPETFRENMARIREVGTLHWEGTHVRKDGTTFPVEVNMKYVSLDRDYLISIVREITERLTIQKVMSEDATRHRLLIEESRDGIVIVNADGGVYEANKKFADMLGYEPEEVAQLHVWDWDYQWDREHLLAMLYEVDESGDYFETRHRRKDGTVFDVEISTNGSMIGGQKLVFCVCRDISDRKTAEKELKLASLVYENSREGMMITDFSGRIVNINEAFSKITGYSPDDVIGKNPRLLQSGEHDEGFYQTMWQDLHEKGYWEGEIWNKKKNGDVFPEWLSIHAAYEEKDRVSHWIAQFFDLTERKKSEETIWKRTNFDMLTELPNRWMLNQMMNEALTKTAANGTKLAFMSLDIDYFQKINEALGHESGDRLLKEVAHRLRELFRQNDVIARVSGDEFAVIMADLDDLDIVSRRATRILQKLAESYNLDGQDVYLSVSIGITLYPGDATTIEGLFNNAEEAMELAKSKGRNHFEFFTPELHQYATSRLALSIDLRKAIEQNEIGVLYQPVVDLASGAIVKAEALARWNHPTRGNIPPLEFINLAEEIGIIAEIDDFVFDNVLATSLEMTRINPAFKISVNKSPGDFQHLEKTGKDNWLTMLENKGVPGENIVVEITESLLLDASQSVNNLLSRYKSAGMKIAQDDFGTGYSSLSYLRKFHIDFVKIDQSFVRHLAPNSEDLLLCEAIISMAHKLGIEVIAEGVEKEEHRELLLAAGCEFGQGYLFSKAIPGADLKELLLQTREAV